MTTARRVAQIIQLQPGAVEAYKVCHANVWPEVLQQIYDCNIRDYSIFFDGDATLFAIYKYIGDDFEEDMMKMRANPIVRKWWNMTDSMQKSLVDGAINSADGPGWWKDIEEVFHAD
ncbi:uncharacterized protein BHQ10_004115 [Talaromyces amestolkiae]|uniref:DUF718 domain-containing protein n=1 Tax=Talaromyces amestolkiae TaxID=1196081 RepID=A0A364KX33_TALAM|nr:uncharacterized protein BHQ10_004115 [Talaromyces amestolkiae]RAO68103.1 hypothetical protein BHQ10_004115 [Talaromyces amestolkiae]